MDVKEQLKNIVLEYKKLKAEGINMDKPEEKPTATVVPSEMKEADNKELPAVPEEKPAEPIEAEEPKKEQEAPEAEESSDLVKLTEVVEKLFEKIEAIEAKMAKWESEEVKEPEHQDGAYVPETEKKTEPPMAPIQEKTSLNGAQLGIFKEIYSENLKDNEMLAKAIKEVF